MGRPRKEAASTSSPRPAAAASKAVPAAPPPSASAARAKATAAGSRSKSAPAAEAAGLSRRPEAKPNSSQPRPAASRGAQGDTRDQGRASTQSSSATQKKQPEARGATAQARSDPCSPRKPPGSHLNGASGNFLPPLKSQDIQQVERETRGQRSNPTWYEWRKNRITASVAPKIANSKFANGKTDEVPQSYLKAVVSSGPGVQTPAMSWGVRNEKVAVQAYEQLKSQKMGRYSASSRPPASRALTLWCTPTGRQPWRL
uniref:YqaJ viral recombinase domain-containing protein n=1 Tax=Dromaius novaehollandiae TaxID=8790 RepID=A0A8C4J4V0_DRONO